MAVDLTRYQEVWRGIRQTWHLDQVFKVLQVPAAVVELSQLGELLEEPGGVASQSVGGKVLVQQEQQLHVVVVNVDTVLRREDCMSERK